MVQLTQKSDEQHLNIIPTPNDLDRLEQLNSDEVAFFLQEAANQTAEDMRLLVESKDDRSNPYLALENCAANLLAASQAMQMLDEQSHTPHDALRHYADLAA